MRNLPRVEAAELEALAKSDNLDITVLEIDITKDDQVEAGVAAAIKASGGTLDVLVNNAGMSIAGPIEAQDMAATQLIFDTNVYGAQRMARAVLPSMRANESGYIFNVTSQLGRVIVPGFGQYSPTKFALEAMSEQMAYEVGLEIAPDGRHHRRLSTIHSWDGETRSRRRSGRSHGYSARHCRGYCKTTGHAPA